MTAQPSLRQTIEAMEKRATIARQYDALLAGEYADAARLLREMARDIALFADAHGLACLKTTELSELNCTCGLDAARERWRL